MPRCAPADGHRTCRRALRWSAPTARRIRGSASNIVLLPVSSSEFDRSSARRSSGRLATGIEMATPMLVRGPIPHDAPTAIDPRDGSEILVTDIDVHKRLPPNLDEMTDALLKPMLEELGDCELKARARLNEVDVLWTKPWETVSSFFRPQQLSTGIIINSIGGLSQQVRWPRRLARRPA